MIDLSLSLWLAQLRPPTTNLQIRKVKDIVHVQMWSFFIVMLSLTPFSHALPVTSFPQYLPTGPTSLTNKITSWAQSPNAAYRKLSHPLLPSFVWFVVVLAQFQPVLKIDNMANSVNKRARQKSLKQRWKPRWKCVEPVCFSLFQWFRPTWLKKRTR